MLIARVEAVDSASKDCMAADADRSIAGCTAVLRRSKETRSNRAKALYNRGIALRDKGDLDRALVDFNEAIQLNPKGADAFNNRGITHRDKGDLDRALSDFNEAIRLSPKHANAIYNRGNTYGQKGEAGSGHCGLRQNPPPQSQKRQCLLQSRDHVSG
jgi:tetratricopeptide (TPR) repeat protein